METLWPQPHKINILHWESARYSILFSTTLEPSYDEWDQTTRSQWYPRKPSQHNRSIDKMASCHVAAPERTWTVKADLAFMCKGDGRGGNNRQVRTTSFVHLCFWAQPCLGPAVVPIIHKSQNVVMLFHHCRWNQIKIKWCKCCGTFNWYPMHLISIIITS